MEVARLHRIPPILVSRLVVKARRDPNMLAEIIDRRNEQEDREEEIADTI